MTVTGQPNLAPVVRPGGWPAVSLQQEDLSTPEREMVQARVNIGPEAPLVKHTHPGEEIVCHPCPATASYLRRSPSLCVHRDPLASGRVAVLFCWTLVAFSSPTARYGNRIVRSSSSAAAAYRLRVPGETTPYDDQLRRNDHSDRLIGNAPAVAHLGVGPRVREGRTHVPRHPVKDCEPSLCHSPAMAGL